MAKLGSKVARGTTAGRPPVILQAQPDSFIHLTSPADLKQWEEDVKNFYGISIDATKVAACETCSGGCSDDCGVLAQ